MWVKADKMNVIEIPQGVRTVELEWSLVNINI